MLLRVRPLLRGCMGPGGVAAFRARLATGHGVFHDLLGAFLVAVEPSLGGDDHFPNQDRATKDE